MSWKDFLETIYYGAATVAALGTLIAGVFALRVYRSNSRLERARWASELYKSFYQEGKLKDIRDKLDCAAGSDNVNKLVIEEDSEFTDYLNFFEYIAFLKNSKQLHESEVQDLFGYYLSCLRRHASVQAYILNSENGYEGLAKLIGTVKTENRELENLT
ncbi:MAG TPA: hypothetical protein VIF64_01575 [Pyrinomonadaceae bacterium]|jgi:hypothetical protein